jgi:hypothetical protein
MSRLACAKTGGANEIPKLTLQTDHSVEAGSGHVVDLLFARD